MGCCVEQTNGIAGGGGGVVAAAEEIRRLLPGSGVAAPLNLGISNVSSGAASYIAPVDTTTALNAAERERWSIGPGAGSTAGHRNGVQIWSRGAFGGFRMRWVVHLNTLVNNAALGFRAYIGMRAATAVIPVVNPSTLTDVVGFGFDPAPAPIWSLMHNDAAGACTVVPLSAAFTANTTDLIAFQIEALRNGTEFTCTAENLTTGITEQLIAASNIPASTLLLSENVWYNTTADVTTVAQIDVSLIQVATAPVGT